MSGYMWAGIGKGIADASQNISGMMYKGIAADQERAEKLEYQRERLAEAARQKEADRQLRLEIAETRGGRGSGSGSGGVSAKDIGEGGSLEGVIAGELGVDVPTLRALRKGRESGDYSAFQEEKTNEFVADVGDDTQQVVRMEYPPGFEDVKKAKMAALARIEKKFIFGKDYDDVVKGEKGEIGVDVGRGILAGTMDPGKGGTAVAASEGKDLYGGDSNVTRQKFTGETKTTPVGQSVIAENKSKAAGPAGSKTYSDVISAASNYRMMAKELRKDAEAMDPEDAKEVLTRARAYETEADSLMKSVKEKRLGSNDKKDNAKPGAAAAVGEKPNTPPDIAKVQGAPKGSTIGGYVDGKGWEVMDSKGKLIGYVRK